MNSKLPPTRIQLLFLRLGILILGAVIPIVRSHSRYVPETEEVCQTMMPHHKREAQKSNSPFRIQVYSTKIQPGKSVFISLIAPDNSTSNCLKSKPNCNNANYKDHHHKKKGFKGFYVQARESREDRPIGTFIPTDDQRVKVHNCSGGFHNAAFHGVKGHKTNVTIEWIAPPGFAGKIIFTTTFVKKFHTFWTHVKSDPLSIRLPGHNLVELNSNDIYE